MLTQIPTHVICGPLGAGKTSLIRSLLAQKPASERWAVLINEFGQIGLDAALLSTDEAGISLAEVSGGCLCCVNGVPFQVGLSRLLRKAKPDRLLIEPSGLGHPTELLTQLGAPPWQDALALQPCLAVLDAAALARDEPLPRSVQQAIQRSGLLLLNKSEALDQADRQRIMAGLPSLPLLWTTQGEFPITALPGIDQRAGPRADSPLPLSASAAPVGDVWLYPQQPVCQSQASADGWSIGWRWHSSQRFDLQRIERWLGSLDWRRAKMVLHSPDGWRSANALAGERLLFKPSEWRKDSRLELIFNGPADEALLKAAMAACRL
ncbi:CobW family GTP-binding protein [Pseudomonas stutzeri]|uniref:CobW family GTP-binding protein n=1 Tax=Stutzerimonas stutzeri TaxID=316 RepID=UPI00210AF45B|nr:CobW family GTP-binding protein [Stutzerimonas stutzeri]MCQ4308663.1 CobW family GTP-binding protein [Stutzerimonas stutzeri]